MLLLIGTVPWLPLLYKESVVKSTAQGIHTNLQFKTYKNKLQQESV